MPGRETSSIWKQPVGLTRCTSLPSVHTCVYTEVKTYMYNSLRQLDVDGVTSQFTRCNSGIDADIESGSDIGVMDTLHPSSSSTPLRSLRPDPKGGLFMISGSNNAPSNDKMIEEVADTHREADDVSSLMSCEAPIVIMIRA